MSYELSFSPEFFLAEGEPYDRSDLALNKEGRPVSVWSAIEKMRRDRPRDWKELAKHFGVKPSRLTTETVFDSVQETNTCSDLSPPVEVWIDSDGYHRLEVWEAD